VGVNQKIAEVLDTYSELERIRSVDEFQIVLGGTTSTLDGAVALTKQLKAAVRASVGSQLRFSAGLGPNHLLAKIAGKLEKPDGLQWLSRDNMPEALAHLRLDDLPGISRGIKARLYNARVWDIPALYNLDPRHARLIWKSVEGERFVRALQGENVPLLGTQRNGYGNSKVLSPENKTIKNAYNVSRWLIEKTVHRLRRDEYTATHFSIFMRFDPEGGWKGSLKSHPTQVTLVFLNLNKQLWRQMYDHRRPHRVSSIGVHLGGVQKLERRSGEMLLPLEAGTSNEGEKLGAVMDHINGRFGTGTVKYGTSKPHLGFIDKG
jgi:DNA polymerase-4